MFPFDFTHVADALPLAVRFLFAWVSDEIGMIVLLLQAVVGAVVALFTFVSYVVVSQQASSFSPYPDQRLHPYQSA